MRCYLSLGSNIGDRLENLKTACRLMRERGIKIVSVSSIYETLPWGVIDQPDFYNACIEVETNDSVERLFKVIKEIEAHMGRKVDAEKYGPRIIDIDIVLCEGSEVNSKNLQIPHPRAHERPFVTIPLAEIASHVLLSGKKVSLLAKEHFKYRGAGAIVRKVFSGEMLR